MPTDHPRLEQTVVEKHSFRPASSGSPVLLRSAAVARLAGMPVATLRIWEQRYGLASNDLSQARHRLYSPSDIQRVVLLRQLTKQGHAIGTLASLDWLQLQQLREWDAAQQAERPAPQTSAQPLRLVVVGHALRLRLQRPAVEHKLLGMVRLVRAWGNIEQALAEPAGQAADLLLWHAPELQPAMLDRLAMQVRQAQSTLQFSHAAIIYRFAAAKVQRALQDTQILAIREPADDDALVSWLVATHNAVAKPQARPQPVVPFVTEAPRAISARRYDDAALTALAGLSPSLACECPAHLAQLLMQLSSFEQYSAGCVNHNPEEARLHTYLEQTAAQARVLLETALERVAEHEGVSLPASPTM